jgi:hypothetical protein
MYVCMCICIPALPCACFPFHPIPQALGRPEAPSPPATTSSSLLKLDSPLSSSSSKSLIHHRDLSYTDNK